MKHYLELVKAVLNNGELRTSDYGDTFSLFGKRLKFDLRVGLPIVTTRKVPYQLAINELACFLEGSTDVRTFHKYGVKFWDKDCKKESWQRSEHCAHEYDLGNSYGYQWKAGFGVDQIETLIHGIVNNPKSRRHLLITFNPRDVEKTCLPPCYLSSQFYVSDGKYLDCVVTQRSADLMLGVVHDNVSFAVFQSALAAEVGLIPRFLTVNYGDVHIYATHAKKALEQTFRMPLDLPKLRIYCGLSNFDIKDIKIDKYICHEEIRFPFMVQK